MKGSQSASDILIPKGVVIAYPIVGGAVDADGGIDLGYCQEADMKVSEETRTKYTARDASKTKIIDRVIKTDYELPLKLMSVNADNLAMIFRGQKSALVQAGGCYGATALDITAPAALDRAQKLGKRGVSVTRINYKDGTGAFTAGETLSAGASTATIVWVEGTVATGSLYVVEVSGADFVDGASLTDGATGAATQNGDSVVEKDIVLTDETGNTRYSLDTDYGLDPKSGTVFYLSGGSITAGEALKGYFDYASLSEVAIKSGATGVEHYQVEILPFSDENENRIETIFWKAAIKADATIKLITEADEEISIDVTLTPLEDGPNSTTEEPVFRQIVHPPAA